MTAFRIPIILNNLLLSSAVIHCFVRDPISANDDYAEALHLFNLLFSVRYTLIVLTVLQLPLILFGLTLLLCGAGYTPHQDAAVLSGFHRIPFDLYVLSACDSGRALLWDVFLDL